MKSKIFIKLQFLMLNQQRKKFKSHDKGILRNNADPYFRKTSPNNHKSKNFIEAKSYKKLIEFQTFTPKQSQQSQGKSKQLAFLRYIPATTKNTSEKLQQSSKNIKQIKIPSFFKKPYQNKQFLQTQETYQTKQFKVLFSEKDPYAERQSLQESVKSNTETQNSSQSQQQRAAQLTEYGKLNNKINYLLNKISSMKVILDKKRQQKLIFMEMEKSERSTTIFTDEDRSTCSSSETPIKQFITQVPQHKDLHTFTQNPYSPRHSIYYVSQILRAYRQQKSLAREHLLSSIEYLRMFHYYKAPEQKVIEHMKVNLPKAKGYQDKKTIIFDLDETLIHCNQNVYIPSDFKIKVNFPTGEIIQVGINVRPFAKEILAALSKKFQIIVFTASHSCYANVVLDHLDPERKHIHHRLFRQHCYCTPEGIYVKDLRILNRNLAKTILVDNAAYSYAYQPLNGVPIIPYYEGKNDYELPALLKYIESLVFTVDVREKNRNTFKLDRYHQFDDLNKLVEMLYTVSH